MDKQEFRETASLEILGSLIESSSHPILESLLLKDLYVDLSIHYADLLWERLNDNEETIKERLEKWMEKEKKKQ